MELIIRRHFACVNIHFKVPGVFLLNLFCDFDKEMLNRGMKACLIHHAGGAENLLFDVNVPRPSCGPKQVVVQVAYAGLNFIDIYQVFGFVCIRSSSHFHS